MKAIAAILVMGLLMIAPTNAAEPLLGSTAASRGNTAAQIAKTGECSDEDIKLLVSWISDTTPLKPKDAILGGDTTVKEQVELALVRLGKRSVPSLVSSLSETSVEASAREKAINTLAKIRDERSVEPILAFIKNAVRQNAEIGYISVSWIGPRAVPVLLEAFDASSKSLQMQAASNLGEIGDRRAARPLLDRLAKLQAEVAQYPVGMPKKGGQTDWKSPKWDTIVALRQILPPSAKVAGPETLPIASDLFKHSYPTGDTECDAAIILSLGLCRVDAAADLLIPLLTSNDYSIRRTASESLMHLSSPRTAPDLAQVLHDEDRYVRHNAATALGAIGNQQYAATLRDLADKDSDATVREAARKAVEELSKRD